MDRHAIQSTLLLLTLLGCSPAEPTGRAPESRDPAADSRDEAFRDLRETMVRNQIRVRGVRDERVLAAMLRVPRHRFVRPGDVAHAYEDHALPIGCEQTISQPYIVAVMSEAARVAPGERVLEIGTGSGYQAAILGELAREVYSIEIIAELGQRAAVLLAELGYENVECRIGDGYAGWPEQAPFDAILLTAAPSEIPQPLIEQLKEGGRLVAPVGDWYQELELLTKRDGRIEREVLFPVRFVPMTGRARR
ncbi:MAG: protein-L-isoaspartate(D-aspartate) O-methyltransferase [Planctomycetota bacterium]